jgi:hypothetical protein
MVGEVNERQIVGKLKSAMMTHLASIGGNDRALPRSDGCQ